MIMKILSITKESKEFNGMPYTEFNLRAIDANNIKRCIKVTGKVPILAVESNGNVTELGRLDKCGLNVGSDVDFWFDLQNRITMIEVHPEDPVPAVPPDDNILY